MFFTFDHSKAYMAKFDQRSTLGHDLYKLRYSRVPHATYQVGSKVPDIKIVFKEILPHAGMAAILVM